MIKRTTLAALAFSVMALTAAETAMAQHVKVFGGGTWNTAPRQLHARPFAHRPILVNPQGGTRKAQPKEFTVTKKTD